MFRPSTIRNVGAPDPERRTSPIVAELEEEPELIPQVSPAEAVCYFNDTAYANDSFIRSGSMILKCRNGVWVETAEP